MRRVEFYFRETASGMRRNGTVAFGAVSTAFIALFLFGLALLIRKEISLVVESITGNVQVQVYLDDTTASHPDLVESLRGKLLSLPAVDAATFENKQQACDRAKEIFKDNPTIIENVSFGLEVIGKPKHVIDQRVPEILEYVGLGDKLNNYPDELSGGEQQRVSIARACVNRPLVLLADEPTGNLDPNTSVDIMRLLDKVNKIGTTVVMATHDQAIVDAMRKRVIELDKGKVVRDQSRGVYS